MASLSRQAIFLLFALALALLQQSCGARLGVRAQNGNDELEHEVKQYIRDSTRESIVRLNIRQLSI
jgi:hypothetical protein